MPEEKRKKNDHQLLMLLACGATVESASREVNLSERTIYKRLADPDFKQRLAEFRAEMVRRSAGTLSAAASESVRTLVGLLQPSNPPPVRLGAARAILEIGIKMREAADLEQRLCELERQVADIASPTLRIVPETSSDREETGG
jgi:HEAT repeat protein